MTLDLLAVLERETAALADLLASGDATAPVPGCPGWSLADLGRHTGGIHLWAREALLSQDPPGDEPAGPADDDAVPQWYSDAAGSLLETLHATPADQPCWTFDRTNRTAGFWRRRQAHETTLHRWDAGRALGRPAGIEDEVARDGIDEVLGMFLPRQVRLGRVPATDDVVHLLPAGTGSVLPLGTGELTGEPLGTVTGPAEQLLLLLWRRIGAASTGLAVGGDPAAVAAFLDRPFTP